MEQPSVRALRVCDVCNQADDHPRHKIIRVGQAEPQVRHMDCCASQGCEICQATEQQYGERRGQELIDHLDEVRASNG